MNPEPFGAEASEAVAQPYSLSDSALNLPHPTFPRRTFAAALERVPVGAGEGAGEDDATVLLSSHLRGDSSSPESGTARSEISSKST